jgi:undecaprenyl-diphosphatase
MDLLQALILGVVQGLTEFVPVSSSGHLVLTPWYLGWQKPGLVFDTTLHLGTLVALLLYFWRDLWLITKAWLGGWRRFSWTDASGRLGWMIVAGTVPAVVLGVLFQEQFESLFARPRFVAVSLLATGTFLAFSERTGSRQHGVEKISLAGSLLIGLAQAAAITPGISRSGATIAAGLGLGLTRTGAARFSFLLGVPVIAGAGLSQLFEVLSGAEAAGASPEALAVGFLAAAISGYLCIRFLLSYLQRGTLYVFAAYCWALGLGSVVIWALTGGKGLG